ncbi:hypothetical protein [Rhizobium terrae]|uniref:hypothetical protein n=1 Tax=Rhizobium terrae TaxID=2171756 RepID=UPI000E3D9FC6|nr:hypothetical protein [Rhizobium terrae]
MIESISGATETPSPSSPSTAPLSAAASIVQTLTTENALTSFAGAKEAATRHSNETAAMPGRSGITHARSLGAVDDVVVRNLLDSLSPATRIAGSFFLADGEEPAPKSLIAMYYEDV